MKNNLFSSVGILALLVGFTACVQFGNLNPKEVIARKAMQISLPLFEGFYDRNIPLAPSSRSVLPDATPPSQNWRLGRYRLQSDGTLLLSPGEHWFPVMAFCMKSSGGAPSGHLYRLSEMKGSRAKILRDLHVRGVSRKFSTSQIQFASWCLQSGARFEKFSSEVQKTVQALVPEHVAALRQSAFEQIRNRWNQISNASGGKIPSFESASDTFLSSLGDLGESLREMRNAHDAILRGGATYDTFRRNILPTGPSAERGTAQNTPWSRVSERIFARFITQGHYQNVGMLQVRVARNLSADWAAPAFKIASLHWLPIASSMAFSIITEARAEDSGCDNSPDAATPFDPGSFAGDPGSGKIQPLGMAAAPPMPNPVLGVAAAAAAAAAIAATMNNPSPEAIAKAIEDLGKDIANTDAAISQSVRDFYEQLLRWYQERFPGTRVPPPKSIPGIPGMERIKPQGEDMLPRWKDADGNIYEWDYSGELEKYDPRGKNHDGGYDPVTGNRISPAVPGRCAGK